MKILVLKTSSDVRKSISACRPVGPACNCYTQCTSLGKK